jgi:predicted double-glycine peptidase
MCARVAHGVHSRCNITLRLFTSTILAIAALSTACAARVQDDDETATEELARRRLPSTALPVPIRHQPNGYTCGPTSLAAILAFWQVADITPTALASQVGTTSNSTEPFLLRDGAKKFGLHAEVRGKVSAGLDAARKSKLALAGDTSIEDLRKALCVGSTAGQPCTPSTIILDLQAWDVPGHDYSNEWQDGHYVVLVGIDADDTGNAYLMDPYLTESESDKAYARIPLRDPKSGLDARWHDFFGELPPGETVPPESQRFHRGAIFIKAGAAGTARTSFENGGTARSQRVLKMD